MKRLLFILLTIFSLSNIYVWGIDERTEIILQETDHENKDIDMPLNKEKGPVARSIYISIAYAYIYNNVVNINFSRTIEVATVTITNETTGKTIYSESSSNPVSLNIDLNSESSGSYLIEIETENAHLEGSFSL